MRLQGKVAIVTGAASGFGAGIAKRFAAEGAKVALLDINGEGAAKVAAEAGGDAIALRCDVTSGVDLDVALAATLKAFGKLDIVVNNAGWTHRNKPILEVTEAEFDRIYAINVKSIYLMTQRSTPILRDGGGGSVINIGSTAGVRPRPGLTWYNGSKGFVNLVSKSLAVELAPMKIRVNCIAPVLGQTGLTEDFMGGPATPELLAKFLGTIPLGRMSRPEDIASACVYLASDEAEFITGVVLPVDGGRTI
jgi:3-oxoacyl-[acyl-carrier protein] reductase